MAEILPLTPTLQKREITISETAVTCCSAEAVRWQYFLPTILSSKQLPETEVVLVSMVIVAKFVFICGGHRTPHTKNKGDSEYAEAPASSLHGFCSAPICCGCAASDPLNVEFLRSTWMKWRLVS